jgi:hypothetical protein
MSGFPKKLSRKTKHKTPRCQLYQPGFNTYNSCWLEGAWITVPAEGFKAAAMAHEALYKGLRKQARKQHHRGAPTPEDKMTPAQRQAWMHFSGEGTLDARHTASGHIGPVGVTLAGGKPDEKSLRWLRSHGYKILPKVVAPDGKTVTDQSGLVPPDLLADDKEAVNTWQNVVKQNRDRAEEMSRALAQSPMGDFARQMALHGLVELEESILRNTLRQTPDDLETPEEVKARYVALRKDLEKSLGPEQFAQHYQQARASHNQCARANLDNSKGRLYCFVLPEFRPDGTHALPGPKDFPWAYPEEYALPENPKCTSP